MANQSTMKKEIRKRIRYFKAVADNKGFTAASNELAMTQPAITFQIRELEDFLETKLFDRSHNRVELTVMGKKLYEFAKDWDGILETFVESFVLESGITKEEYDFDELDKESQVTALEDLRMSLSDDVLKQLMKDSKHDHAGHLMSPSCINFDTLNKYQKDTASKASH